MRYKIVADVKWSVESLIFHPTLRNLTTFAAGRHLVLSAVRMLFPFSIIIVRQLSAQLRTWSKACCRARRFLQPDGEATG